MLHIKFVRRVASYRALITRVFLTLARLLNSYRYLSSSNGCYFGTASPSFLLLVRGANSRRVQTPSIIALLDLFSSYRFFSFIFFSYRFHIVPFFVLLFSVRVRFVSRATEMVDTWVRCFLFFKIYITLLFGGEFCT